MLKRTTKPLRRTVLIEEGLAKSQAPQEAFRIKGALWNAEQNKNTNNNS